jgi:acyl-CoA synthetase (AMP-forming)/AMP-acid ligase II
VWPAEVEDAIRAHTGVLDVAVAGRPDPEWGEHVVAFVVPRSFSEPPTLASIRAFVSDTTASFKAPKEIELVESLAVTPIGKVRRPR